MRRSLSALLFLALAGGFVLPASVPALADTTYDDWKKEDPDAAQDWLDKMKELEPDKTDQQLIDGYNDANKPDPPPANNPNTGD